MKPPAARRRARLFTPLALLSLAITCSSPSANADPLSTFGFGARAEALAGAVTADASGQAAAFHNPAGVARSTDSQAALGWSYGVTRLRLDGNDARVTSPHGLSLGLSIPFAVGPITIAFGLALYLPDQFIARIQLTPVEEPRFVLLDNNLDRIVVTPVLALRVARWLSLGIGATLLADAAGRGVDFDVGVIAGERVGRAGLDVSLPLRAAVAAGATLEPRPWLRIGLTYRGAIDLSVKLDVLAHVDVAGALTGQLLIALRAVDLYTPQHAAFGVAIDVLPSLTAMAEVAWVNWAAFPGGVADLRLHLALSVTPPLVQGLLPDEHFRDVWVPRFGLEYRRGVSPRVTLAGRVGYAFERSPVPDQTGLTSFADNDRSVIGFGAGVGLGGLGPILPAGQPLRFDVGVGWHELHPRTTTKDAQLFPGAGFSSGGRLVHLTATIEARF